jgi:hypothetical protein
MPILHHVVNEHEWAQFTSKIKHSTWDNLVVKLIHKLLYLKSCDLIRNIIKSLKLTI